MHGGKALDASMFIQFPGQRVVLAHGVFDVLHLGHIRHLQEARAQGDRLIVSVTADHNVNKGIGRPRFTAAQRVEALMALECVDYAFVTPFPTASGVICNLKPDIYVKGIDYANTANPFHAADCAEVEKYGGKVYITKAEKFSSSRLINAERHGENVAAYLARARERGFAAKIKEAIAKADEMKIVFIGENIVDEYVYVTALGKPSKEFILATAEKRREQFFGGIVAAAKHCEWKNVSYVSQALGLIKTRFVDEDFTRKLFEVYSEQRLELTEHHRAKFARDIDDACGADVTIVMDFGHGLIDDTSRRLLEGAKFFAVNAQTNAGNVGFNPVTLYNEADLVCVDEPEARFATYLPTLALGAVALSLMERVRTDNIVVTRGKNGALACCRWEHPIQIPAFTTTQVTDTIGAGDAFLATAAPLLAAGLELEAAAFAGNVAGAIKTTIVGHRSHVTRDDLLQNIEALLA
jgi:rfaE bifunctional protein nucleotidyltransferase chain/domain